MSTLDFVPRAVKKRKVDSSSPSKPAQAERSNAATSLAPPVAQPAADPPSELSVGGNERREWPIFKHEHSIRDPEGCGHLTILVWLAISDYAIWNDGDLRRRLDLGINMAGDQEANDERGGGEGASESMPLCEQANDDLGYVPLSWLFKYSQVLRLVSPFPKFNLQGRTETAFINNIRSFGQGILDARFIVDARVSSTTRSSINQLSKKNTLDSTSMYEVRRTSYASWKQSKLAQVTKEGWDELTLYVENIPSEYRKLPETAKLLILLLPPLAEPANEVRRVQHVHLPPHHRDQPEDIPQCKGFALVTFSTKEDVEHLLRRWPWEKEQVRKPVAHPSKWNRDSSQEQEGSDEGTKKEQEQRRGRSGRPEAELARSRGLRVCTKARWEELRREYLAYGQRLADELTQQQDQQNVKLEGGKGHDDIVASTSSAGPLPAVKRNRERKAVPGTLKPEAAAPSAKKRHRESIDQQELVSRGYPAGCIVLVRNLHYGTNKTALKMLFARPWQNESNDPTATSVTYVDYAKNMEACYVRCLVPDHAQELVDYFSSHRIIQTDGLDGRGTEIPYGSFSTSADQKPIVAEVISGTREKFYWDKQSGKVRSQAMEQTLQALSGDTIEKSAISDGVGIQNRRKKSRCTWHEEDE